MNLPKSIDPIKFAKHNAHIAGQLLLKDLSRLQAIYDQQNQIAEVDLHFGQDEARIYYIQGQLKATLNLHCERCNKPMQYDMNLAFALSPVTSDDRAKALPDCYEPIAMNNDVVSVMNMIEDEILLALPMVAKHDNHCLKSCS